MRTLTVVFLVTSLWVSPLARESVQSPAPSRFIVWNVGQGLWTTWVENDSCFHFDAGGERAPWRKITALCSGRRNFFSFSHWDMDHIDFAAKAAKRFRNSCRLYLPGGTATQRKKRLIDSIEPCQTDNLQELQFTEIQFERSLKNQGKHSSNDESRIYVIAKRILAPGDSTAREEKKWAVQLKEYESSIKLLILGHHGSKTSTSDLLIKHLPFLRQAIASARRARYGHPHALVVERLKRSGIAILSTEDWGSVEWQLPPYKR